MKILELHVEGFRSLKDVTWRPGDLNVVIGPNGSGKSNLLRLLELISASAKGQLGKHIRSLGGIGPLLWDGRAEAIRWTVTSTSPDVHSESQDRDLKYETAIAQIGSGSSYRVDREALAHVPPPDHTLSPRQYTWFERRNLEATGFNDEGTPFSVPEHVVSEDELLLPLLGWGFHRTLSIGAYCKQLAAWSVYHSIDVSQRASVRQAAVARYEKRIEPDGQNLISVLHTLYTGDREFKQEIHAAMTAAFGEDFEELVFPPAADQRIQLRIRWKSLQREQSAADLSDGTLRFLLLLAILASPDAAPLIAIDEPETGLHPSMLPIIAEYAADAAQRSQIIFTTHSPQFLDAFKDVLPTTTVALWEDGQTVLKVLDDDTIKKWLAGYSLGRLFTSGELESLV